jgi:hypothetical protein
MRGMAFTTIWWRLPDGSSTSLRVRFMIGSFRYARLRVDYLPTEVELLTVWGNSNWRKISTQFRYDGGSLNLRAKSPAYESVFLKAHRCLAQTFSLRKVSASIRARRTLYDWTTG